MRDSWRTVAACRNRTATMFDKDQQTDARSLCDGCPVEQVCLWASLREEEPNHRYGMAGGMTPGQRAVLARRLPAAVVEAAHDAALVAWELRAGVSDREMSLNEAIHPGTGSAGPPSPPPPAATERDPVSERIVGVVAAAFGIAPDQVVGPSRTRHVVEARQVAMYVLREGRGLSYPAIGEALGGRDHTTAMHSVERVRARMAERPGLRRGVERLVAAVGTGDDAEPVDLVADSSRGDVEVLLGEVAKVCGVCPEHLLGRSRMRHVAEARQVAMYVLREARGLSYPAIGQTVGGRDHTTAMHAVERVRRAMMEPGVVRDRVELAMAAVGQIAAVAA